MLVIGLCMLVWAILKLIPFNVPSFNQSFSDTVAPIQTYLNQAISFIYTYVIDYEVVKTIFTLIVSYLAVKYLYKFFMWVIRKLPISVDS